MGYPGNGDDGAVGEADGVRQGGQPVGDPVLVVHQQGHAGAAAGAHGQGDDNGTATRVYAQADPLGAGAAAPFHDGEAGAQFEHLGRRHFHGVRRSAAEFDSSKEFGLRRRSTINASI